MATAPKTAPMTPAADPMAAQGEDPGSEGGYTICIKVAGDGSLSVGVETDAQEAAEDGSESEDKAFTPVPDIKSAFVAALDAYKNDGEMQAQGQDEADFNAGFGGNKAPVKAMG